MDALIYLLALVPGFALCFVRDVGWPGGIVVMFLGLLVAPYSATAVVCVAGVAAVWIIGSMIHGAFGGRPA